MERLLIESQFVDACRRLARKGFLISPADSFSMRIPGHTEMMLASGLEEWGRIASTEIHTVPFDSSGGTQGLHATIYRERADVGAVAISSPRGARLLAKSKGRLLPLFDEQIRHIGSSIRPLPSQQQVTCDLLAKTLRRGGNAVLLGEQLLCLGMTCERVLFNTELYEKCAQAYVIAAKSGHSIGVIPAWVRLIANHRLLKDECDAAASYRDGRAPEGISAY